MHLPRLIQHPVFQIRWIRDWRHFRQAKCLSRGCHAYDERLVTNVLELGAKNVPWLDLLDPWLDPWKNRFVEDVLCGRCVLKHLLMHVDSWLIAMYILIYIQYIITCIYHNYIHSFGRAACLNPVTGRKWLSPITIFKGTFINLHYPPLQYLGRTQYIVFAWYSVCWQMWNF